LGRHAARAEQQTFYGKTVEECPAWCLAWLKALTFGFGPLLN
jgi:hypothetical protein